MCVVMRRQDDGVARRPGELADDVPGPDRALPFVVGRDGHFLTRDRESRGLHLARDVLDGPPLRVAPGLARTDGPRELQDVPKGAGPDRGRPVVRSRGGRESQGDERREERTQDHPRARGRAPGHATALSAAPPGVATVVC